MTRLGSTPHAALRGALLALLLLAPASAHARPDVTRFFTFEDDSSLVRWAGRGSAGAIRDSVVRHGGRYSGRIERTATSPEPFSSFTFSLPVDFRGDTLEFHAWMRWSGVTGHVTPWLRLDAPDGVAGFASLQAQDIKGDSDWREFTLRVPLDPRTRSVVFGGLVSGTGTLWLDDVSVLVNGHRLAELPEVEPEKTVLDLDHEFDAGSRIALEHVTPVQADNLALLARVWGFLKYHHSAIVAGRRHWDFDLFRIMPAVLAAGTAEEGRRVITAWVDTLPPVPMPASPAKLPADLALAPDLGWLRDPGLLGDSLSAKLVRVYERRPHVNGQFYVEPVGRAGNPKFVKELPYARTAGADAGFRLLALFRWWNAIEYWAPDRDVTGENWPVVLRELVPVLVDARTREDYELAVWRMSARMHDTHGFVRGAADRRPPAGPANLPVAWRCLAGHWIACGYTDSAAGPATGVRIGDALRAVDGVAVDTLVARARPYYPVSNEAAFLDRFALALTRGDSGMVRLGLQRGGRATEAQARRTDPTHFDRMTAVWRHDLPGPTCRRASGDLAYVTLSTIQATDVDRILRRVAGAKCLVVDIRNYPGDFVVFALGSHLVARPTPFAVFTEMLPANPGAFRWEEPTALDPVVPAFGGRLAILVDESSISQAEYTALAFRSAPGAIVAGSTTQGADGNVSEVPLPGGLSVMFSGLGIFTPDRRPTQRVGIVPDLVVRPTAAGLAAGRDEVLEAAVKRVLGRDMTAAEREAMRPLPEPAARP